MFDKKVVYTAKMKSEVTVTEDLSTHEENPFLIKRFTVERQETKNQRYAFFGDYANEEVAKTRARQIALLRSH